MKEVTVIVPNKVGALAEIAEVLGGQGINIIALSAQGFGDKGVIRLITNDERSAVNALTKYISTKKNTYEVRLNDVLVVTLQNRPGELAKICKKIAKAGINIESVYLLKGEKGIGELVIRPEKIEEALSVLKENNIHL